MLYIVEFQIPRSDEWPIGTIHLFILVNPDKFGAVLNISNLLNTEYPEIRVIIWFQTHKITVIAVNKK